MKILIIENSIAFTGAIKCALNEADILSDQHSFIFVLPRQSSVVDIVRRKGYTVYTLPLIEISKSFNAVIKYPFFFLKNLISLKKIVRREQIDVVQVNDFYNLLGAGLKITGYAGKLLTYVRFLPSVMPAPLRTFWIAVAQKYSYRVIAVSDAVLQQLPAHEHNIRIYDPVHFSEKYFNTKHNGNGKVLLLYPANFTRGKGQEYAIAAFSKAYEQNKNIYLKFVGADMGLSKNAAFKKELIEQTVSLGLEGVIDFAGFTTDIEREMKAADIVLNFSEAESLSMTCLEASFYGIPVIASKCGGPEEIIVDGKTGLLVENKNIPEMTAAILRLANDAAMRSSLGVNAYSFVRENFSVDNFQKAFSEIFK